MVQRAQGCLLGQLAGDSLGSLVEFSTPSRIIAQYKNGRSLLEDGGCWSTIAGQPTDDSELALALARSIVARQGYDLEDVAKSYVAWMDSDPFDVGNTIGLALGAASDAPQGKGKVAEAARKAASRSSQANGALMRISPLGIFAHKLSINEVMALARADAQLTHPHPVCQDANAIFAASIAFAIRSDADRKGVYQFTLDLAAKHNVNQLVSQRLIAAANELPAELDDHTKMGWVLVAFQNAFYQLLHATSLQQGVIATVRFGGDSDTNAAIAGALLGSVYGRDAIPDQWQRAILSCRPTAGAANVLQPRPEIYWPVDALELAEKLLSCSPAKLST